MSQGRSLQDECRTQKVGIRDRTKPQLGILLHFSFWSFLLCNSPLQTSKTEPPVCHPLITILKKYPYDKDRFLFIVLPSHSQNLISLMGVYDLFPISSGKIRLCTRSDRTETLSKDEMSDLVGNYSD